MLWLMLPGLGKELGKEVGGRGRTRQGRGDLQVIIRLSKKDSHWRVLSTRVK